jgi:hypothetical protein
MSEASEDKPAGQNRLWEFINSAFGLWLLSTLAVSGGAFAFQQWRDWVDQTSAEEANLTRLEYEVAARVSQYLGWFEANLLVETAAGGRSVHAFAAETTREKILASLEVFADLPRQASPRILEVFPEFRERSMISLLAELVMFEGKEPYGKTMRYLLEDQHTRVPAPLEYATFRKHFADAMLLKDLEGFGLPFTTCIDC